MSLLKCTDEEVEHAYEEFYEDVHTEFLKFGEIINFKVCKNCSPHLRGNVYVHYKSLDSAVLAYKSLNGRYFAGKQVQCEFVSVTKWRVAICGEFMRSKLKTCSRGIACNFIHCFGNPGGDYEWADWDKPPPRYWVQKMVVLFGCSDESTYEIERESSRSPRHSSRCSTVDADRYHHFRRSQSRDTDYKRGSRNHYEDDTSGRAQRQRHRRATSKTPELVDEKHQNGSSSRSVQHRSDASTDSDTDTDKDMPEKGRSRHGSKKRSELHINGNLESHDRKIEKHEADVDAVCSDEEKYHKHASTRHIKERTQQVGRVRDTKSKERCSVEERQKDVRQRRKVSTCTDDCWDGRSRTDERKSTGHRYREDEGEHTFADSEQSGNETSKANHHNRRDGDEDCKHVSTERSDIVYGSRKYTSKWEQKDSGRKYKKESKRKRDAENSDSESRLSYLEGRRQCLADHQFDEDIEDRGRWEP